MRLRHMNDRHCDLPTQIDTLSRETTEMFLATLGSIDPTNNTGEELYLGVLNAVELDWNDKTHNVCTEFIQSSELGIPDCTRLTITVTNVTEPIDSIDPIDGNNKRIETVLTVSALLGHLHTEYHIRYIPVDWSLSMMKTVENDFPQMFDQYAATGGVVIAVLRALAIQLGVQLVVKSKYIDKSVIDEMHTYGMPQSNEMLFLRFGLGHLMDLIKNTAPDNTTD